MLTLTSMSPPLARPSRSARDPFDRGGSTLVAVAAAVATIVLVASVSLWATSSSNSTPTRTVATKAASGLTVEPATPVVRSANAAEAPLVITPGVVQSTNAAEAGEPAPTAPAAIGHTAHVPQLEPQFQVHAPMARFQ